MPSANRRKSSSVAVPLPLFFSTEGKIVRGVLPAPATSAAVAYYRKERQVCGDLKNEVLDTSCDQSGPEACPAPTTIHTCAASI